MAGDKTIKLFKFTQKMYEIVGICSQYSNQERISRNVKHCLILCCLVQLLLSSAAYLWLEADSMIEYGMLSYSCTTLILGIIIYSIVVLRTEQFFNYIQNFERFIAKSKCFLVLSIIPILI